MFIFEITDNHAFFFSGSVVIKVSKATEKIGTLSDKSFTISPLTDRQVTLLAKILSIREVVLDVIRVGFVIMG